MPATDPLASVEQIPSKGSLALGGTILVLGQLSPLSIPLVAAANLPDGWKTTLTGVLLLGIPELSILAAVTILGKPGFNYLKLRIFGFIRRQAPADSVSPLRYHCGLALFLLPILFGWMNPYVSHLLPSGETFRVSTAIAGDVVLLVSLFVLGGDFWDKLRSLFLHGAKAQMPNATARPAHSQ